MKKISGVESAEVSLKNALTDIRLKPGNTVTLAQIREVIKNGGFNSREAQVTAVGRIAQQNGRLTLDLAPAKAILSLEADKANAAALAEARKLGAAGTDGVEVEGVIPQGDLLRVTRVTRK